MCTLTCSVVRVSTVATEALSQMATHTHTHSESTTPLHLAGSNFEVPGRTTPDLPCKR